MWPKADDKNLIRLVKEHNYHNWNDIAVEMGVSSITLINAYHSKRNVN